MKKALPEFFTPIKTELSFPTPNTLERLIITLHEFGHAANKRIHFLPKRHRRVLMNRTTAL